MHMQVVASWTAGHADALRQSLRMTNESFAEYLGVSARTVAYWRKRPEMIPKAWMQETLDTALERAPDRAKAQFAQLVSGVEPSSHALHPEAHEVPGASLLDISRTDHRAEFGDTEYVESIGSHIREIVALDNRFGGVDLVNLSARFFRTVHRQVGAGSYDPRLEHDLQSAAAELAELVGWLAYDAEAHDLARRMNQESLYYARLAGDKVIELLTLQNASMHAAAQGRPREALQIARSVLEGDYQLSPRLRAMFLIRRARALGQGGDESSLRSFSEIRSLFLEGVSDADPAWAWWIDEHELDWQEAMVQRDLGLTSQAITQFEQSVAATPTNEMRGQYIHRAYLLQAQVDNRTWDAAEQTIRQMLPLATEVASARTVVLLRDTLRRLATCDKVPLSLQEQAALLGATLDEAPA
jgi:transcriptional regulator with XRE-family HTH domain